ncbi:hypothetical protein SAMN05444722_0660 [Rhodovulum sp. ES.010]|uniref:hypothetical protein n=1 Tax=Rhodovulum sp. ES.010 TaxID=1882821 RepID=UPI00092AB45C|nr:hypothetical protein [Rhodovulum sp. ES.010]SIO16208.1 hypothetical protein SAMN05444722_0660 [Rhodovulum sp. ES.010]
MREKHPERVARRDGEAPNRNAVMADKGPARVGRHRARAWHYLGGVVGGALVGLATMSAPVGALFGGEPSAFGWAGAAIIAAGGLVVLGLLASVLWAAFRGRHAGRRFGVLLGMIVGFGGGTVLPAGS